MGKEASADTHVSLAPRSHTDVAGFLYSAPGRQAFFYPQRGRGLIPDRTQHGARYVALWRVQGIGGG
jgi:hypothetical protein